MKSIEYILLIKIFCYLIVLKNHQIITSLHVSDINSKQYKLESSSPLQKGEHGGIVGRPLVGRRMAFVGTSNQQLKRFDDSMYRCVNLMTRYATDGSGGRRVFIGGNWKCYGNMETAVQIVEMLNSFADELKKTEQLEVVVAPSTLHVPYVSSNIDKTIQVATQDVSAMAPGYGAYTGETIADAIKDFGLKWCVAGHSERRQGFHMPGETNEVVAMKVKNAIDKGLNVILCIGEQLNEREAAETMSVLSRQLDAVRVVLSTEEWERVVIAYEPVWAIGTGKTATPQMAQQTHHDIRGWLKKNVGEAVAAATPIIYGGSVKASNAEPLIVEADIDGFLVGGASVKAEFIAIINAALHRSPTTTSPNPH